MVCETEVLAKFSDYLNCDLGETGRYAVMDGIDEDNKIVAEVKTRTNVKSKYPTTMMPFNKIQYWKNKHSGFDFYFIFRFKDRDCFYKYNEEDPLVFERGGRRDRGRPEINDYCFVPIDLLTDF